MKKVLSIAVMLICVCATSFAQDDIFANFTVDPADGSTITDRQMSHLTFTFHDVHNITIDGNKSSNT